MLIYLAVFVLLEILTYVQADDTVCGSGQSITSCYGAGAYCCGLYNDECCWGSLYSYWWFWFVWFWVFVLIMSCSLWLCIRRRRRQRMVQPGYVVVDQHNQYGSVVSGQAYTGYNAPSYTQAPGYSTQAPGYNTQAPGYNQASAYPATAPAYQEKPPPYSADGH